MPGNKPCSPGCDCEKHRRPDAYAAMPCAKPTGKFPNGRTGTRNGYMSHRYRNQEPCEPCREAWNAYCMTRHNAESRRTQRQVRRYGLTADELEKRIAGQNYGCAICGVPDPQGLVQDHRHGCCSKPHTCDACRRGLLCRRCNTGIGMLQDDPGLLRSAADYLEKWEHS